MKNEYLVRAHRTETKLDTRDNLMSQLDVQVPADALEFLRAAHNAQETKDVTFQVQVVNTRDGDYRTLKFTSKGSKMKDFVPVATLEKFCDPHDNLTALFDRAAFELNLIVEVKERQRPDAKPLFEEEEQEPTVIVAGVLNAPKEVLALPGTEDIQDAEFVDAFPAAFLDACTADQLGQLFAHLNFGKLTDPTEEELAGARAKLLKYWHLLEGTNIVAKIRDEQATRSTEDGDAA
ncbi:hypothetical protein [Deinococcus multiflagellatus]|uniref:Uncharacterized protein n=1 Tax=Deinococcus multiflagellatus TaxID=1656887 RepID=A0ABW1ZEN8_9DEIO|nr:hypothetical protein [Deinococcus multiflagellatus]MBZ9712221.1 hypothetical protein [Deinococcus multiflagellatus]